MNFKTLFCAISISFLSDNIHTMNFLQLPPRKEIINNMPHKVIGLDPNHNFLDYCDCEYLVVLLQEKDKIIEQQQEKIKQLENHLSTQHGEKNTIDISEKK